MLQGQKILLGISGSIASYKAAFLTRLLVKQEAVVQVIMTPSASDFITPLTLATLSKNPALTEFVKNDAGEWNNHVDLGLWADLMVIAPATANTIAALAHGQCQNLLQAVYLSARCPVMIAPAMDLDMFKHPGTQANLSTLQKNGNIILNPGFGELASGLEGRGRMAEPEEILEYMDSYFERKDLLKDRQLLITAGPTHERIDPVRFIGNHSSGKMGYAIAEKAAQMGAKVNLISGPTQIDLEHPNVNIIRVNSAQEMYEESLKYFFKSEIIILAAAVADYTPELKLDQKIKKKAESLTLKLVKTTDIASALGRQKKKGQIVVGFALETQNELDNALAKLDGKNFDLVVLNSLNDQGAGFGGDTNKVTIIDRNHKAQEYQLKPKKEVAIDILDSIIARLDD